LSLPNSFIQSLQDCPGFDETAFRQVHQSGEQVVSVRLHPNKINTPNFSFHIVDKVPWSSRGHYLAERPSFTLDPLFHAGAYYVQEASSMFLEEAIRQLCPLTQPLRVLDLCAAPGGKSTLIQSLISEDSLLVSNEVIKPRASVLVENMAKWGGANVVVTNNDPAHFKRLGAFFDLIVVDAPCSGSGLFRKDPDAIGEWSLSSVEMCALRQQRILADVMDSLKPGGVLIYSTCSYSSKEDEDIADFLAQTSPLDSVRLLIPEEWNVLETSSSLANCYGYRFYPDKIKGEGFFLAAFKKREGNDNFKELRIKNKPAFLSKAETDLVCQYVKDADKYRYIKWQEEVLAFPAALLEEVFFLQSELYLKKLGVKLGTIIRNQLIPHHEWATSTMSSAILPMIELDEQTALQYLRRNEIDLNTEARGWALVSYRNLPLGLVKLLPGRINNYYPKEWRILNK
jgi:16S rRNA C967 or C1407 C5-methylase (RsmB/RsmF family)/NOL1/NOP2/fmu family ribosome biogenesis protein